MTTVLNLLTLAQSHKPVSCPSCPIAGSTETRQITYFHQPGNDLIQAAAICDIKLSRTFFLGLSFCIATYAGTRAATNLGNSQMEHPFSGFLTLSGRNNHACVRHRNANTRHQLSKNIIADTIAENSRINVVSRTDARYADCMRSYSVHCLQMLGMH